MLLTSVLTTDETKFYHCIVAALDVEIISYVWNLICNYLTEMILMILIITNNCRYFYLQFNYLYVLSSVKTNS